MPLLRRRVRARTACSWCHVRKVRCDATIRGTPCTRCHQDGRSECILRDPPYASVASQFRSMQKYRPAAMHTRTFEPSPSSYRNDRMTTPPIELDFLDVFSIAGPVEYPSPQDTILSSSDRRSNVPEDSILAEFVDQYFLHIHPGMPVVDEAEVSMAAHWHQNTDGPKVPLLIILSLLFASCPYVPMTAIRACGFESKRTAWNAFYNRAKALFESTFEDQSVIHGQAAVLLALHSSMEEPRANNQWLARAVEIATSINMLPESVNGVPLALRKRLWWSIIHRDTSLCLGLRRISLITPSHMELVPDLLNEDDIDAEINHSRVYDPDTKRMLLTCFQQQCKLAVVLSDMFALIPPAREPGRSQLSLIERDDMVTRSCQIKDALNRWEESWKCCIMKGDYIPEAVSLHMNLTAVYLQTARLMLAQFEALVIEETLDFTRQEDVKLLENAGSSLQGAIAHLQGLMEYFSQRGQVQSLPLSIVAFVIMPLIISAIDHKLSPSWVDMETRRRRLEVLGDIVRLSQQTYDITDGIVTNANQILQLAYTAAQDIFLKRDLNASVRTSLLSNCDGLGIDNYINNPAVPISNWNNAFFRYPRVYVLISTSVDYYLNVGVLPSGNALPKFIRFNLSPRIDSQLLWNFTTPRGRLGLETSYSENTSRSSEGECAGEYDGLVDYLVECISDPPSNEDIGKEIGALCKC